MSSKSDFHVYGRGHDTVLLLRPVTAAAQAWCDEYLPADCPMLGTGYAIENRYLGDILCGIEADGLTVSQ